MYDSTIDVCRRVKVYVFACRLSAVLAWCIVEKWSPCVVRVAGVVEGATKCSSLNLALLRTVFFRGEVGMYVDVQDREDVLY